MAIPVYLFLTDDGGAKITGSVDVHDREGSIEVTGFTHNLRMVPHKRCRTGSGILQYASR